MLLKGGECIWIPPSQGDFCRGGSSSFLFVLDQLSGVEAGEGFLMSMDTAYVFLRLSMGKLVCNGGC